MLHSKIYHPQVLGRCKWMMYMKKNIVLYLIFFCSKINIHWYCFSTFRTNYLREQSTRVKNIHLILNGAFAHLNKSKILSIDIKKYIIIVTRGWHIFSITQVQNILFIEIKATQIILTMAKFYNTLILMTLNVNKEFFSSEVELLLNNKI